MPLYKRKDSPYFYASVTVDGQTFRESTETKNKREAERYESRLREKYYKQIKLGERPDYPLGEAIIRFVDENAGRNISIKWQEDCKRKLKWFSDQLGSTYPLAKINQAVLSDLRNQVAKEPFYVGPEDNKRPKRRTNDTVNRFMSYLTQLLNRAHKEWGWLSHPPALKKLPGGKPRVRWEPVDRLMAALPYWPVHYRRMIRFSLLTGLRASNLIALERSEVDLDKCRIHISAEKMKSGKPLITPIPIAAIDVLKEIDSDKKACHPTRWFISRGKPLSEISEPTFYQGLKKAGIEDFTWHDLRHTWASWHVQNGTPLHVLMELGGWASYDMVLRYAHLSYEQKSDAVNAFNDRIMQKWTQKYTQKKTQ